MTSKEFFSKENVLSSATFNKVKFKTEISDDDYKRMGALALSIAFQDNNYIPLSGRIAIEYPIIMTLLDIEVGEDNIGEDIFKALVCFGLYGKFREKYLEYAEYIERLEMDVADLISYKRAETERDKGFWGQIAKLINSLISNENLATIIESLAIEQGEKSEIDISKR